MDAVERDRLVGWQREFVARQRTSRASVPAFEEEFAGGVVGEPRRQTVVRAAAAVGEQLGVGALLAVAGAGVYAAFAVSMRCAFVEDAQDVPEGRRDDLTLAVGLSSFLIQVTPLAWARLFAGREFALGVWLPNVVLATLDPVARVAVFCAGGDPQSAGVTAAATALFLALSAFNVRRAARFLVLARNGGDAAEAARQARLIGACLLTALLTALLVVLALAPAFEGAAPRHRELVAAAATLALSPLNAKCRFWAHRVTCCNPGVNFHLYLPVLFTTTLFLRSLQAAVAVDSVGAALALELLFAARDLGMLLSMHCRARLRVRLLHCRALSAIHWANPRRRAFQGDLMAFRGLVEVAAILMCQAVGGATRAYFGLGVDWWRVGEAAVSQLGLHAASSVVLFAVAARRYNLPVRVCWAHKWRHYSVVALMLLVVFALYAGDKLILLSLSSLDVDVGGVVVDRCVGGVVWW